MPTYAFECFHLHLWQTVLSKLYNQASGPCALALTFRIPLLTINIKQQPMLLLTFSLGFISCFLTFSTSACPLDSL